MLWECAHTQSASGIATVERYEEYTYRVVNDFRPANASCAIREILLFDKSIRFNRLKLANAFGVISVIKFCSKRLQKKTNYFCVNMVHWRDFDFNFQDFLQSIGVRRLFGVITFGLFCFILENQSV